jgi:hypothetical protein
MMSRTKKAFEGELYFLNYPLRRPSLAPIC